ATLSTGRGGAVGRLGTSGWHRQCPFSQDSTVNLQGERSMSTPQSGDVVRLATAPNPAQAHIWQQALEEEGIQSHVVGDYLDAAIGNIPGAQAEVWVHRNDLARAEEILQRGQQVAGEEEEAEEGP